MSGVAEWTSRFDLHCMYLRDGVRNAAYAAAIAHHVRPGSRVLDLGTGTGIWACVAANAGAAKVVAVEFSNLADLARETVGRATCVHDAPGMMLAPPQLVHTTRLGIDRAPPRELRFEAVAERDAIATGVLAFVEIDLGVSAIRTGPLDAPTNWGQLYIPAAEPMRLDAGARYAFRVTPSPTPDGWDLDGHAVYPVRHYAC